MKRIHVALMLVLFVVVGMFIYSNTHGVHVYFMGKPLAILGYVGDASELASPEETSQPGEVAQPPVPPTEGTAAAPAPMREAREIPVFLLVILCFGVGFFASWLWSLKEAGSLRLKNRKLRKELDQVIKERDDLRRTPPSLPESGPQAGPEAPAQVEPLPSEAGAR